MVSGRASTSVTATRALSPGGMLVVVDLLRHDWMAATERLAHRWPGFGDDEMDALVREAGLEPVEALAVSGPLETRLWAASLKVEARAHGQELEFAR